MNYVFDIMDSHVIREREELSEQIRALQELKAMAKSYDCDISKPAQDTKEAIQWLYFGYLAAVKEQNGAAMSLGRVSTHILFYIIFATISIYNCFIGRFVITV